ncbi:MAG: hypothetical protein ACLTSS_04360 [Phocaeicola coprocola]
MEKNTMDHMEELKQQFAILTDKLESQEINNERLFRTVMKTKMKSINKYYYWLFFLGLPIIILCFQTFYSKGQVSLLFYVSTVLLAVLDTICGMVINKMGNNQWQEADLLTARQTLVQMKQRRKKGEIISIPLVIIWLSFFVLEVFRSSANAFMLSTFAVIGGLLGLGIGLLAYRKMQRTNDELIQEIDQLKKDLSDEETI